MWAAAVHRKARLVKYTEFFFSQLQDEERKRVELLAEVYKQLLSDTEDTDLTFYLDIIHNNKTIPIIYTNDTGKIISNVNIDYTLDSLMVLTGDLLEEFSKYEPIEVPYAPTKRNYL